MIGRRSSLRRPCCAPPRGTIVAGRVDVMSSQPTLDEQIHKIVNDRYCVFTQSYERSTIERMLTRCRALYENPSRAGAADGPYVNRNQPIGYNLQNKDFLFIEALFECPQLEALLKHFLNDLWYRQIPQEFPNY